jgi:hypothetical protein
MEMAGHHPRRCEQPVYHNGDMYADEDRDCFSPYVAGPYDERNRYLVLFV